MVLLTDSALVERKNGSMTRVGIISDVHADVHALRDGLKQLPKLECDHIVCAWVPRDAAASLGMAAGS